MKWSNYEATSQRLQSNFWSEDRTSANLAAADQPQRRGRGPCAHTKKASLTREMVTASSCCDTVFKKYHCSSHFITISSGNWFVHYLKTVSNTKYCKPLSETRGQKLRIHTDFEGVVMPYFEVQTQWITILQKLKVRQVVNKLTAFTDPERLVPSPPQGLIRSHSRDIFTWDPSEYYSHNYTWLFQVTHSFQGFWLRFWMNFSSSSSALLLACSITFATCHLNIRPEGLRQTTKNLWVSTVSLSLGPLIPQPEATGQMLVESSM